MGLIADGFKETLRRIELNPTRVTLTAQRYNAIKDVVEANIAGATVKQIGSFQRRTKIRPLDLGDSLDVDALVTLGDVFKYAAPGAGTTPASALEKVRRALRSNDTYRVMDPRADAPVVVLEYFDGLEVEVAVGYAERTGKYPHQGDDPPCYIVAGASGDWIPADYDYDAQVLSRLNQTTEVGGRLVPAIKLIKQYLRTHEVPLKSFHTEILATTTLYPFFQHYAQKGFSPAPQDLLSDFLANAKDHLQGPIKFEGSYSPAVDSGVAEELNGIGRYLREQGETALELCRHGDTERIFEKWQKFFGAPFPPLSSL